jgi:GntR family transcriptional regulator, transcriptional repressor for pyruvate dehydrogenase complex
MDDTGPSAGVAELFSPVTPGRISGLIVEQIRSLIREGRLSPGDRLPSERDLAEQFGVSRVTVRDALRALEATGLVEVKVGAGGGGFLRAPSSDVAGQGMSDMLLMAALSPDEVAEARLMFELDTVGLAARRATPADLAELRDICERSAELLKAGAYDVHLSWDFHDRLARATHNAAIELITRSFRGPLSMARARAREPSKLANRRTVAEHTSIVDALEAGDSERARAVLSAHLIRATNLEQRLAGMGLTGIPDEPEDGEPEPPSIPPG